ncbi:MAG: pseudouridine synthase [Lachnospiraceae bacterium]|nr:pseudouridine synthase [Lachnospiraceae bacterium]
MRINKYLSECGVCSRREADRLVEAGEVLINGQPAVSGSQVEEMDQVLVKGKAVSRKQDKTYLKLYKPRGIVCTSDKREKKNLIDYLRYPVRVTYAGRLDRDSEGLLILTDDGDLINAMMRARENHEKEYLVTVDRPITSEFLEKMRRGVYLEELEVTTRPCKVEFVDETTFRIILTQGLNRQIRRMCQACGRKVRVLKRIRVVNIRLDGMKTGDCVPLTEAEKDELFRRVKVKRNG